MSQSPLEQKPRQVDFEAYRASWSALNKLLRSGYSWSGHEANCAFLNLEGKAFANVSAATGFDYADDARALALADWDGDGDQDVFLSNRTSPRLRFLRNDQRSSNASVTLELRGTRSNRDAIGARVELTLEGGSGPRRLLRSVRAGEGYLAQSSTRLCFGLGAPGQRLGAVRVAWPGGSEESFRGVEPGRAWRLVEGSGVAVPLELPRPAKRASRNPPTKPVPSTDLVRVPLVRPVPLPRLDLVADDGGELSLFGIQAGGEGTGTGRALLLELFSSSCAPCVRELEDLARNAKRLEQAGIAPLALSVEPATEREATRAFLSERGWPFPWASAAPQALELLEALPNILLDRERPLAVPTSFLVDARGALRVLYLGPVDAEQILADLQLCELGEGALFDAVSPFGGRWMFPGLASDADFFEGRLRARGLEEAAREFARGRLTVVRSAPADLLQEFGRRSAVEGRMEEAENHFRRALSIDPRHLGALFDLAVVLHRLERLGEAAELYGKVIALQPENADARFNLALARIGLEDRSGAERELRWLEARKLDSAEVLARLLDELGDGR